MRRFEELCGALRQRIDKTWLGCVNTSKSKKNHSSLEEHRAKYHEGPV